MNDLLTTRLYSGDFKLTAANHPWIACLIVLQGNNVGNKFLLEKDRIQIGRMQEMDICLEEHEVSRNHAAILRDNHAYTLIDQSSKNGTWINSKKIASAVLHDKDLITIGGTVFKFLDENSDEQSYYEEIYRQTVMDKVLQVFNKNYFFTQLEQEMERCRRYGGEVSLLLLDVDRFKLLNDTYGHLAGDAALLHLANLIKNYIRRIDFLCRYGGEEFAVILPNTDCLQAFIVAEHMRIVIAETPLCYDAAVIAMSVSIGVAGFAANLSPPCSGSELIGRADRALYAAKQDGRNKVVISGDDATR